MSSNTDLAKSIRNILSLGIGAGLLVSPSVAFSQDDADEQSAERTERIQVTGSRILREGAEAPSPVTVISGQDLIDSGAMNIGEVLSRLPALANTYTLANSGRFIGTAGVSLLDLRGMGTSRTLVLVDGQRHVASSTGSASVDTNTIPSSWIDRVEIITGGASAVYGADAVTGAVNFILKRDIQGFDATATKGFSEHSDYENERFTVSYGTNFADNRGNVAVSAEYNSQDRLNALDHPWTRTSWSSVGYEAFNGFPRAEEDALSPNHPDTYSIPNTGHYRLSRNGTANIGGDWYTFSNDGQVRPVQLDGIVDPARGQCQAPCDFINLRQYSEIQPEFERFNVNLRGNYEVTNNLLATFDAKYVRTDSEDYGQPYFNFFNARGNMQRDNAYVTDELGQLMDDAGAQTIQVNKMHDDVGRRFEENTRETTRFVVGLEGYLTDDWSFDSNLVWGKTELSRANDNNVIIPNWLNAVDAVFDGDGNIVCRDADARAAGCVPINNFGREGVSQEARDYVATRSLGTSEIEQTVVNFNVNNPFLYDLPAGAVGFAGGFEYREEKSSSKEDPFVAEGDTFFNALGEVDGKFDVAEVYGELAIPLLADQFLVQDLILETAVRFADYSTIGNATSWKVGLDWTINDELRARFTVSEALRAPNITELFRAQSQTFYTVNDPCRATNLNNADPAVAETRRARCAELGVPDGFDSTYDDATLEGRTGGNAELQPEESTSYTVGLVYQPSIVPGLSVTMDYWEIDITDTISGLSAQRILNECVDAASINNQFCARVDRRGANPAEGEQGEITVIENFALNIARSLNRGIDFEVGYDFDALGGAFRTGFLGTYLIDARSYPFQEEPDEYTDFAGVLGDAELQARFTIDYVRDNWSVGTRTRYTSGVDLYSPTEMANNPNPSNIMDYGSYAVTDLTGTYRFDNGVRLTLGLDNVLDRGLPKNTTGTGAGSAYYDNIGRFGYVRVGYSF
ncbi:TonB-dependent receptor [Aliidiomarina minuta]|uniref:TonB-dependent receptor n=1 Tax=Aliidiomarina minuta TaxID=880057 RepID=A0A432W838_9GAMM|nr:TonB-dependent receptor [Aliidiomarina minuta]RUO26199.1 TonB-dependent receptor [Aliidiomarina minuta]